MFQTYTLFTTEIDSPLVAVEEIQQQMTQISLCKNTVGIVACHYDHVEYGVIAALQESLPFPLVGCTTFLKATPEVSGLFELTITVLTSDDVFFASACSNEDDESSSASEKVIETYKAARSQCKEDPTLILSFISANRPMSGDEYLRILDKASGGVPSIGVVDSGEDESGTDTYIISDKKVFNKGVVLLFFVGDLSLKSFVTSPADERLLSFSAVVTSAEACTVKEINQQVALDYLYKNGIDIEDANNMILTSVPFYFHESRSDSYVCRLIKAVHEDGALEFMAEIPEGALLRVGTITSEDILEESERVTRLAVAENPKAKLFLIASCVGRFITLGLDTTSEIDHVTSFIPPDANYMACYVGGEICPIEKNGTLTNCYHNNSLIILALQ